MNKKSELYGLTVFKADEAIKEFYSSRADNMTSKNDMYSKISKYGYVYLNELNNDIKSNQTLNTIDTYLLGAGLKSDLVDSERATAKKILTKQVLDTELEKMTGLKKEEVKIVSEESSNIDNNYIYLAVNDVEKAKGYIDYELTEETNGKYVNYTLEGLESFLKNNNIKDYNYYIKISTENLDLIQLKEDSDSAILKLPFAIDIEESDCKKLNI